MSFGRNTSKFNGNNFETDDKIANAEDELLALIDNES